MQITDIRIHQPIGLLRILTDDGLEGWCLGVGPDVARHIQAAYRDVLVGQDALDRERHWQQLPPHGSEVTLHVHHSIREEGWTLYGFSGRQERDLFRELVAVSGVFGAVSGGRRLTYFTSGYSVGARG